jgi:3-hydroxyisobutyrate dehydrogenase-like beta-hydroxyacid dehydrogenase
MNDSTLTVGWIGAGKMGNPMSRRLLGAGATLAVFDTVDANCESVVAAGGRKAASVADAAGGADIVFSMIPNDAVLRTVAFGDDGVLAQLAPGAVFCDMSTVAPETSAEVAEAAADKGIAYLRAPVSGSSQLAETGTLTVLVSGPVDAFARCRPAFDAMGTNVFHVGEAEQARYLKLVLNLLIGTTGAVLAEALTLGRKGGLDWQAMLDVISESAAASPYVKYNTEPLKARDFAPLFSTDQMVKDANLICDAATGVGVPLAVGEAMRRHYLDTQADGFGDDNMTATILELEKKIGLGEP